MENLKLFGFCCADWNTANRLAGGWIDDLLDTCLQGLGKRRSNIDVAGPTDTVIPDRDVEHIVARLT